MYGTQVNMTTTTATTTLTTTQQPQQESGPPTSESSDESNKNNRSEDMRLTAGGGQNNASCERRTETMQTINLNDTSNSLQPHCQLEKERKKKRIYSHSYIQTCDLDPSSPTGETNSIDKSARRRLIAASIICLIFMIGTLVGGILSNSLAIATDAAHLLTDFASFMISLFAIWLSSRPATKKMSFGWHRAEVIGALLSVLMIWLVTGLLVYMAIERLVSKEFEIDSLVMVITASAGLLVNIIMAIALKIGGVGHSHGFGGGHSHGHSHDHHHQHHDHKHDHKQTCTNDHDNTAIGQLPPLTTNPFNQVEGLLQNGPTCGDGGATNGSGIVLKQPEEYRLSGIRKNRKEKTVRGRGRSNINVRAAFIHVIGDFLQSLGVLIAALVIHFEPSYAIVDPICTFLFSIIVLITTINIIRDAINVLMEGMPRGINFTEVHETLQQLPGTIRVHNLRIWSLSLDKIAISTHLVIDDSTSASQALKTAIDILKSKYNFFEVTIQVEECKEGINNREHCKDDQVVIHVVGSDISTS